MDKIKNMTTQNRLIILGLLSTTIVMLCLTCFAVNKIRKDLDNGYKNFGQIISKTLAIESVELTKDLPELGKYDTLRSHTLSILNSNDDISFIEFRDSESRTIYSSEEDYSKRAETAKIVVNSPMLLKVGANATNVGSVMVGLSGTIINEITDTTTMSLIMVFALTWGLIVLVMLAHTILTTKELKLLQDGVKKISSGTFGIKVESQGMSKEAKQLFEAFNDMSSRLHKYEEQNIGQLTLEKNKLEAILACIANGVVVCDNYDNIILVNAHAQKLLDVTPNEILKTKIQQYCDTSGEMCFKERIEQFKDTPLDIMEQRPLAFNIEVNKRIIKSVMSPMFTVNREYVGYIIVLIDVTKEIEMDNLRSHFISNVSHELRTPVTVLRSYIDTLYNYGNEFDFNTQKEFIGVMNQEIVRLNRMVNDILDFSRYESQNVKLEKTKQDIMPVIEDVVDEMKVIASEHNLTFSVMKEPDLPEIPFNKDSIRRVLSNIVSNAIKYSPDGKRIRIKAERARVGDFVEVSVEDQGQGIAEEYLDKIFDRFFRIENDTHTIKGTGLGLHLVKISVEKLHQGQVFVQSKLGEGSTFGFRLPINPKQEDNEEEQNNDEMPVKAPEHSVTENNGNDGWEFSFEKH
ncbi:PAS domain-containing protein [bacterium]|nr:PAS domain-containing protein [bacterium]